MPPRIDFRACAVTTILIPPQLFLCAGRRRKAGGEGRRKLTTFFVFWSIVRDRRCRWKRARSLPPTSIGW